MKSGIAEILQEPVSSRKLVESLHGRLFRYHARVDREPLEDFLTESLCSIFDRMPPAIQLEMLQWIFSRNGASIGWIGQYANRFCWKTQVSIARGRIDAVLYAGQQPILVVESKVWSGFRSHDSETEGATQVHTYCDWLASAAPKPGHTAALIVSATGDMPDGFLNADQFNVASCAAVTWARLGKWLCSKLEPHESADQPWQFLTLEFTQFLKEQKLSEEIFTNSDLSSADLFLPAFARWKSTFDLIWRSAEDVCKRTLSSKRSSLNFQVEGGMIWQWRYGQPQITPKSSYVAIALRFPEHSSWYEELSLPNSPHFLLIVSSDRGFEAQSNLPKGWAQCPDGDCVIAISVHDIEQAGESRDLALANWARTGLLQAETILKNA